MGHQQTICKRALGLASPAGLGLCLFILGCGGGGQDAKAPLTPPRSPRPAVQPIPEGAWTGSVLLQRATRPVAARCVVLAGGEVQVRLADGYVMVARHKDGVAQGKAYSLLESPFPGGARVVPCKLKLFEVRPRGSFTGAYEMGRAVGSFIFDSYQPGYEAPLAKASVAGSYQGELVSNNLGKTQVVLHLNANGQLTGSTGDGETVSGLFSIPDPTKAVLQLKLKIHERGARRSTVVEGVAWVTSPEGASQKTLEWTGANDTLAFTGEFQQQ